MKRHAFLLFLVVGLCVGGCGGESAAPEVSGRASRDEALAESKPLNVVLISLDTFRADRLSQAPFISDLADKGWQSTRVWSSSNWTLPAHVSLLTSTDPSSHDVPSAGSVIPYTGERFPAEMVTLAETFRAAGYFTAATTDGGFLVPRFGLERGFERFVAEKVGDEGDSFARHRSALARFLEERGARPFFLFVHTYEIHDYFLNTPPYHRFVDPEADREAMAHGSWLEEIREGTAPKEYVSRLYDSGIRWTDEFVEALVGDLKAMTPGEDLLVVITSDHGESFGDRPGLWHHGDGLWEEQLRVPLVAWGNYVGAPSGLNDRRVSLIDIAPSVLAESGIEVPISFEGRPDVFQASGSVSGILEADSLPLIEAGRVHTGADWGTSFVSQALIESDWKYYRRDSFEGKTRQEFCFNLLADPEERNNRMADRSSPCREFVGRLADRLANLTSTALHVTALSAVPIELEFDDGGAVIGVRTAGGSSAPIGRAGEGAFRWQPKDAGDQLVVILGREPEGRIRVAMGPQSVPHALVWSELLSSKGGRELTSGPHSARVLARRGVASQTVSDLEVEPELIDQLEALGYAQ